MSQTIVIILIIAVVLVLVAAIVFVLRRRGVDLPLLGDDEFDGIFILSLERSAFTPCKKPGTRYWLSWPPEVKVMDGLKQLGFDSSYAEVHLRFEGELKRGSATGYGHLGQYTGEVIVKELHEVSRAGRCK